MRFRNALLTDTEYIRQISEKVFGKGYYPSREIREDISNNIMVVCIKNNSIVGFKSARDVSSEQLSRKKPITSIPLNGQVGYLKTIGVKTEYQNEGIGSKLVNTCMDTLNSSQYFVEAWRKPTESKAGLEYLLEKHGFKKDRTIKQYWADQGSFECKGCQSRPCECTAAIYIKD